ncbi:hypothetical protein C5C44_15195 [Rathayibacter sp. AY1F6]|uniref:hypothetical protein n=1 Tax=unclassified Rathayibacter TaxID=2609250 RepID=UPI000CE8909F|nr:MULTISPECIES: hypothetical protein [unclassified Rathayibacter]PPG34467.1 hypothetical protein C5C25_00140 [Rathayibacter sp. AY2B9]PPH00763.1 hypothetical protein C5C44_15195 [Rathayibacter sp. AY1F6]
MKNSRALRIGARVWAGTGLLVVAALYLLAAPSVDDAEGAQFAAGVSLSQGTVMRVLAVLDVLAGLWVLIRPRSYPGITAAAVAVISLWLAPRLGDPALVPIGALALDVRFVTHPIEVSVVVAGLAVTAFWMTRNLSARARARRG